jgi:hypothetical protein
MIVKTRKCLRRVLRILASAVACAKGGVVVIVDLSEDALAVVFEAAEVMFPVGVVAFDEAVEGLHFLRNLHDLYDAAFADAGRECFFLPRKSPAGSAFASVVRKRSLNLAMVAVASVAAWVCEAL